MTTATSVDAGDRAPWFNLRVTAEERALVEATARTLGCSRNTAVAVLIEKGSLFPLNEDSRSYVESAADMWGTHPRAAAAELLRLGWAAARVQREQSDERQTRQQQRGTTGPVPGQTDILDDDQG